MTTTCVFTSLSGHGGDSILSRDAFCQGFAAEASSARVLTVPNSLAVPRTSYEVPIPVPRDSSPQQSLVAPSRRYSRKSSPSPFRFAVEKGGETRARQTLNATAYVRHAHVTRGGFELLRRLRLDGHDSYSPATPKSVRKTLRSGHPRRIRVNPYADCSRIVGCVLACSLWGVWSTVECYY